MEVAYVKREVAWIDVMQRDKEKTKRKRKRKRKTAWGRADVGVLYGGIQLSDGGSCLGPGLRYDIHGIIKAVQVVPKLPLQHLYHLHPLTKLRDNHALPLPNNSFIISYYPIYFRYIEISLPKP